VSSLAGGAPAGPQLVFEHYPDLARRRPAILEMLERSGTPVFLCDPAILADRYQALQRSLAAAWPQSVIAYSFKTNYQIARLPVFRELGGWAEVVSGREYRMARELGYPGRAIIFNGPYKTPQELSTALSEGAQVHVNDHGELDTIIGWAVSSGAAPAVGMRLSCSLPRLGASRFGFSMDTDEAATALAKIAQSPQVSLAGFHMHLHGDTDEPALYQEATRRLGEFARRHVPDAQRTLRFVDVGGGFPAHTPKPHSRTSWGPRPINEYIDTIAGTLRTYFPGGQGQPRLMVEPGRYLTADAVVLVTRVLHVVTRDGIQTVTSNGSISMVPLTHYSPQVIRAYTSGLEPRRTPVTATVLFGATCRENDILYKGDFVEVAPGDYLVHYAAGAYNANLSPGFIFDVPRMECI
jgi:diaminopimelate decarboxylase